MSNTNLEHLIVEVVDELRTTQRVTDAFDESACQVFGINRSDGRCLDVLEQHGPLTAGELARECDLSLAAVTALVDRMENAGLMRRRRDERDRRRVLVELTAAAHRHVAAIFGPLADEGMTELAAMPRRDLRVIRDFLRSHRELLERHHDRVAGLVEQSQQPVSRRARCHLRRRHAR
ncbi:MAG: MarR family winged helix-turn-helix transcriptional regulator [Gaiella sp.]